jgi:hypothetical protein
MIFNIYCSIANGIMNYSAETAWLQVLRANENKEITVQRINVPFGHHLCLSVLCLDLGQQCHQKERCTSHNLVLHQISSSRHTQQNSGKVADKFRTKIPEMSPSFSCRQENLCSLPKLIEEWNNIKKLWVFKLKKQKVGVRIKVTRTSTKVLN